MFYFQKIMSNHIIKRIGGESLWVRPMGGPTPRRPTHCAKTEAHNHYLGFFFFFFKNCPNIFISDFSLISTENISRDTHRILSIFCWVNLVDSLHHCGRSLLAVEMLLLQSISHVSFPYQVDFRCQHCRPCILNFKIYNCIFNQISVSFLVM